MANTFKSPTLDGSSIAANTSSTVYTTPSATTTVFLGIALANISASTIYASVLIEKAADDNIFYLKDIPLPTGSTVDALAGKLVLQTGDVLKVKSDTANSLDTILSIMEQT